nr:hypothetical protein [Tanacetum cinerariifolium]
MANLTGMMSKLVSSNTTSSSGSGTLPSNTITNPKEDLKGITTRSGVAYQGPKISTPSKVVKQGTEVTKDQGPSANSKLINVSMPNLKPFIPYPSRRDNERRRDQANKQIEKFYEIFKDMSFEISFTVQPSVIQPEPQPSVSEPVVAPVSTPLPNVKPSIPYPSRHLSASINLMPLSVWEGLSLPELTSTCMTLELADRLVSKPLG